MNNSIFNKYTFLYFLLFSLASISTINASAQCPPNIDFEQGTFAGWQCYTGTTRADKDASGNDINIIDLTAVAGPVANRQTMINAIDGVDYDPYGYFPTICPNGSGHSIKLGNATGGHQAEGVSYTFTIPFGQNKFSLIYYYAVVLQDPPHPTAEQPRFVVSMRNVTDNMALPCPLDPFVPPTGGTGAGLPGFETAMDDATVLYKPWAAASINLDNMEGKTIELFFKTADCTHEQHFGYAYIDVNSECSSSFVGATYCPDDAFINVTAPYGYSSYSWYDDLAMTHLISTTQVIHFAPPPPSGTTLYVRMEPFSGYGCTTILTAELQNNLTITANAGGNKSSCNGSPVQLGQAPKEGHIYSWSPTTGLSDPDIANPIATPANTTTYTLTEKHEGGGCISTDQMTLTVSKLDNTLTFVGTDKICVGTGTAILKVAPTAKIQWYKDNVAIPGATSDQYAVTDVGDYYAALENVDGCKLNTEVRRVEVYPKPAASFSSSYATLCHLDHQFTFTSNSTLASGTMNYLWDFGDNNSGTLKNETHSYATAGSYPVKLTVTSDHGCVDNYSSSVIQPAIKNTTPDAKFSVNDPKQCDNNNNFIFTDQSTLEEGVIKAYHWDFGDGQTADTKDATHTYAAGGTFHVVLSDTTAKDCVGTYSVDVLVYKSPVPEFTVRSTCSDLPLVIGNKTLNLDNVLINYHWDFGNGDISPDRDPKYAYPVAGLYTITLQANTSTCSNANTVSHDVYIEAPVPGILYPDVTAVTNFREQLQARSFGANYLWTPATSLSNPKTASPLFQGITPQLYTIKITTDRGCVTVDTQYVKTIKKIEIYVPTAFTPGYSPGMNDYLKPGLMGIKQMNYFKIYDRWGKLLFATKTDLPGWDGRVNGQVAELQTVVWMIEAVDLDGNTIRRQGTTVLLK